MAAICLSLDVFSNFEYFSRYYNLSIEVIQSYSNIRSTKLCILILLLGLSLGLGTYCLGYVIFQQTVC